MNEPVLPSTNSGNSGFNVIVLDMSHYMDPDEEQTISGFATVELAHEYARRRTRDSLEEQRPESTDHEDLRRRWHMFGEDCLVPGDGYCGGREIDYFIAHPATAEERDWIALIPDPKLRQLLQSVRHDPDKRA